MRSRKILHASIIAEFLKIRQNRVFYSICIFLFLLFIGFLWFYSVNNFHKNTYKGPNEWLAATQFSLFSIFFWPVIITALTISVFHVETLSRMWLELYFRYASLPKTYFVKIFILLILVFCTAVLFSTSSAIVGIIVPHVNSKVNFLYDSFNIWRYVIMIPGLFFSGLFYLGLAIASYILTKNVAVMVFVCFGYIGVGFVSLVAGFVGINPFILHYTIAVAFDSLLGTVSGGNDFPFALATAEGILLFMGAILFAIEVEGRRKVLA